MLHQGIAGNYVRMASSILSQDGVSSRSAFSQTVWPEAPVPVIASTDGARFLENPKLHEEVFGPFSLLIRCADSAQLTAVAESLEGQLTATLMATSGDIAAHQSVFDVIQTKCGRLIMNGVPTGVEVCQAMHHGGPFPASTDARFTSVGADAIKRFARPLAFQNFPDELLPEPLQNTNPLRINRTVDEKLTNN